MKTNNNNSNNSTSNSNNSNSNSYNCLVALSPLRRAGNCKQFAKMRTEIA